MRKGKNKEIQDPKTGAVKKGGKVGKVIKTILSVIISLVLIGATVAVNTILPTYERMIDSILGGFDRKVVNTAVDTTGLDLEYNKADYTKDTIGAAEEALKEKIANEGVVLLKNDGMLPKEGASFSFFGVTSATVRPGAGLMGGGTEMKQLFADAGVGFNVKLYDFYAKQAGKGYGLGTGSINYGDAEDFSINEVPLSVLQEEKDLLASTEGTIPVYYMKRVAGEGRDMPRSMYNHTDVEEDKALSYLEPNSVEREILQYLNDNYEEVVLVLNSNAAIDLDWLADYPSIKAVLNAPDGLTALPGILTGAVNPSGRTVDTFAADSLKSPAAQNFGDYQYLEADGSLSKYNYVSYAEGIYVGYRYYETRYEDAVLGQGNAGDYDYSEEVVYPFGYGLSYTTFDWTNFQAQWDAKEEVCTVTVDVTNTGDRTGKEVVEIYFQSPYTDYDKENGVEKASVALAGYGKTSELAPGATETVTVTFDREQLKVYDSEKAGTYILDAGEYLITAAQNAHAAANNMLAYKGKTAADGVKAYGGASTEEQSASEGDAAMVAPYVVTTPDGQPDTTTYAKDSYSGVEIGNHLDDARGDVTYLTRNDWTGTFPQHDGEPGTEVSTWGNEINGNDGVSYVYVKPASEELLAKLDSFDSGNPVDRETLTDEPVYGAMNGLTLIQMRGLEYSDPQWEDLLDQITPDEYYDFISRSGYGTEVMKSVNKPFCIDADTAAGLIYGGTGAMFPNPMTVAQTWNLDIASEYGEMIGNEALLGGCNGWYAPSMNIHRTPFSGRNGEYYSEDGFLSGAVASREVYGAASKGMYTFIKHFAFNDQEDHRGDRAGQYSVATWLNEQSAREIYLKPFEMCMKAGEVELNYLESDGNGGYRNATKQTRAATAVMTAFNRVGATWTGGSWDLLTGILRNEWAFDGFIMTDAANDGVFMDGCQMIEAGGDVKLTYLRGSARFNYDPTDSATYHYAREAMHHMLYTVANSNAMNGAMPGSVFTEGPRMVTKIRVGLSVLTPVLVAVMAFFTAKRFRKQK